MQKVAKIVNFKYPEEHFDVVWIFDQSSNHIAYAKDALLPHKMNVHPGGSYKMRNSLIVVNGIPKIQHMQDERGTPKGLKRVLEERGVNTHGMKKEDMIRELNTFEDFKNEKSRVAREIARHGHRILFIPAFHPELNPIERVWGLAKAYAREHCDYTFRGLQNIITPAFNNVTLDNMRKYFRKSRDNMRAYTNEEVNTGADADVVVKAYSSHRKVSELESRV